MDGNKNTWDVRGKLGETFSSYVTRYFARRNYGRDNMLRLEWTKGVQSQCRGSRSGEGSSAEVYMLEDA
jgi:hypothetical protein